MTALLLAAAVLVLVGLPEPSRALVAAPSSALPWVRFTPLALVAVVLVTSGLVAAALGLLACLVADRVLRRRRVASIRADERKGAAEALAVLSSELRAGRTSDQALASAAATAEGPFARALHAASRSGGVGADPASCLLRAAEGSAVPELLRGLAACWQVCSSTGSSLASAVEQLAESHRAEQAQAAAIESELAGPRATAAMLAALPVAGIALAGGLGADPLRVLLHSAVGLACLGAGLGLDLLGIWWTGRIVATALAAR